MQYVTIAVTVLTLFTDLFKGMFRSREMKILAVGVVVYIIYSNLAAREKKADLESNLADKEEGVFAVKLFDAIQPILQFKIPVFGYTPVVVSRRTLEELAYSIGKKGIYSKVADAYKTLYDIALVDHLKNNSGFDTFTEYYDKGRGKVGGYTNGKGIFVREGKRYRAYENWRLRDTDSPYAALGVTEAGEVYEVGTIFTAALNGVNTRVATVKIVKAGITMPFWTRVLSIDAFYQES